MDLISYIAIYGAAIGTIGAAWQVRQWLYDRPRLKLGTTLALATTSSAAMVSISIANIGKRPVTVFGVGFRLADGRTIPFINNSAAMFGISLPKRLEQLDECSVYFLQKSLIEAFAEAGNMWPVACYSNIGGGQTFSKKIDQSKFRSWFGDYGD